MSADNPQYLLVELHPQADAKEILEDIVALFKKQEVTSVMFADDSGFGQIVKYPHSKVQNA